MRTKNELILFSVSIPYFGYYRVMAAALSLTFGRGGALIGNLLFGFLIDINCVVPILLFASMLFGKSNNYICFKVEQSNLNTFFL